MQTFLRYFSTFNFFISFKQEVMNEECTVFNEIMHYMLKVITQIRLFSNENRWRKLKLVKQNRYTNMIKDIIEGFG